MYGWKGKILRIDLSNRTSTTEPTEPYIDKYLGGRGLGVRLIYENYKPGTDAFDPANPLIFSMGPLTGTSMPGSGRVDVTALSPMSKLTGQIQLRRLLGSRSQVCRLRPRHHPGQGGQALLPVDQRRRGGNSGRRSPLGQGHP